MADGRYRFNPLGPHHNRAAFSCGVEALDRYFHRQVGQHQRRGLAAPYVLAELASGNVLGYYTLSTGSILPTSLPDVVVRKLPQYESFPAILIGRLAVDRRYRGQGFGRRLLVDAQRRSRTISHQIGAMAGVVDAKNDSARSFYERYGFMRFLDDQYRLFVPMDTIARLEPAGGPHES